MHPNRTPNVVCQRCGSPFYVRPSRLPSAKYCGIECKNGGIFPVPGTDIVARNRVEFIDDGSAIVHLTQGQVARIDGDDVSLVADLQWCASRRTHSSTAVAFYAISVGSRRNTLMHRLIMGFPPGLQVDHVNGDSLDNRRGNLRIASASDNQRNKAIQRNNISGFKGVFWNSRRQAWQSQIKIDGRSIYLGLFESAIDAARSYDAAARKHFGEFAWLNFPD